MKTEQSHKTPAPQSQTSKAATPNPLQKAAKWTRLLNVSQ
jgi:hypothetical protein